MEGEDNYAYNYDNEEHNESSSRQQRPNFSDFTVTNFMESKEFSWRECCARSRNWLCFSEERCAITTIITLR